MQKKFWQSTNFWTAVVLLVGSVWVGFPEGAAGQAVGAVFALVASGAIIRNFVKSAGKPNLLQALMSSNFWAQLGTVVVSVLPLIPAQAITDLETIVQSILGGNWQGAIVAAFSLIKIGRAHV